MSAIDKICPLAITNQLSTLSMHIPGEKPLTFTQAIIQKQKYVHTDGQTYNRWMEGHTDVLTDGHVLSTQC